MLNNVLKEFSERLHQHQTRVGLRNRKIFVDPIFVEQTRYLHPPSLSE
jgi:hypothetical protein